VLSGTIESDDDNGEEDYAKDTVNDTHYGDDCEVSDDIVELDDTPPENELPQHDDEPSSVSDDDRRQSHKRIFPIIATFAGETRTIFDYAKSTDMVSPFPLCAIGPSPPPPPPAVPWSATVLQRTSKIQQNRF